MGAPVAPPDRRRAAWTFLLLYALLAIATAVLWSQVALGAAVALGVGVIELGPLRRQRGTAVAATATLAAGACIVVAGSLGDGLDRYVVVTGLAALAAGVASRWGLYSAAVVSPLALVILSSPAADDVAVARALALVAGGLVGSVALAWIQADPPSVDLVLGTGWSLVAGVVLAVLVGGSLWLTSTFEVANGHWVAASILAMAVPSASASIERSVLRTAATLAGAVAAAVVAWLVPWDAAVVALALLAGLWSAALARDYQLRVALLTVAVVLYAGGGEGSLDAAWTRVVATGVGAVVLATTLVLVRAVGRLLDPPVRRG